MKGKFTVLQPGLRNPFFHTVISEFLCFLQKQNKTKIPGP